MNLSGFSNNLNGVQYVKSVAFADHNSYLRKEQGGLKKDPREPLSSKVTSWHNPVKYVAAKIEKTGLVFTL